MSYKNLSHSDITILKGLLGFGSTGETFSRAFLTRDISLFKGSYEKFYQAFNRLDGQTQQSLIDVFEVCNIGVHCRNAGRSIIPTQRTFIDDFTRWVKQGLLNEMETKWFDDNQYPSDHEYYDKLPEHIAAEHLNDVNAILAKHI